MENVNVKKLVRHVSLTTDRKKLKDLKLDEVVPKPKRTTTFRSFIHPQKTSKRTGGDSQFESVLRDPTDDEIRSLIGLLAASAVEVVMANHFYTIGDVIRRQTEGGSIGSDLTGEAARLYMLQRDKMFLEMLKKEGIRLDLYSRYVDDMVIIARAIGRGWFWNGSSLKWSEDQYEKDENIEDDERTAKVLSDIANSINSNIQTTTDLPSRNLSQRMPVLDLHMWIAMYEGVPVITHSFYKKDVASRYTIMKRSAINSGTKKSTIFQEGLRRLQHISPTLPWKETVTHMSR